ncbi:MAG: hypothetical protein IPK42_10610 [Betaproteobacteria bacterium]|nr:hypothetical protein [Betaproteobacteria bacterium]
MTNETAQPTNVGSNDLLGLAPERESVDDALLIVESYGPWGADLNDAHRRQIVLADEVVRLRGLYEMAVRGRAEMRSALRQERRAEELHEGCQMPMEQARELAASEAGPDWYARGQDWGLADALTNGQSGDWVLDDIARAFAAGAARCAVLELKLEAARRELAKVNNEFGSENAEWPEAWRRVAEVKERAGRLWRDNETMRAALTVVVRDWTEQFERAGHLAPGWVKQAREALGPNVELSGRTRSAPTQG